MPAILTDLYGTVHADSEPKIIGNKVYGLRIFRVGSFADSAGARDKWTRAQLDRMVENFYTLKDSGILPHVPVREDHTRSIRDVVGYFLDVRRDGNFLVADVEFTEPQAVQKYTNKTYRARSAEVGQYVDNDGKVYEPCILGVAFCDIPAVENLYAAQIATYAAGGNQATSTVRKPVQQGANDPNWRFDPMTGEKLTPQDANGNEGSALIKDVLLDLHNLKDLFAGDPDTESALQQVVDAVTAIMQDSDAEDSPSGGNDAKTSKPGAGNPSANHGGEPVATISFTLGGATVEVDDKHRDGLDAMKAAFSAMETRVTAAEAAVTTVTTERDGLQAALTKADHDSREAKVDGWLTDGKINPVQVDGLKAYAKLQTSDQWTAYSAIMDGASKLTITNPVDSGAPGAPDEAVEKVEKIKLARQGYNMLRTTGVTGKKLSESKFAKDLVALGESIGE